jgi:NTE family protein
LCDMARFLNLVFQGGGVRGIAYAGALSRMPVGYEVAAVAGTSAGAIVAALLAIGKSPRDLYDILRDPSLYKLINEGEQARFDRVRQVIDRLPGLLRTRRNGTIKLSIAGAVKFWFSQENRAVVDDLNKIWEARGFHQSSGLRTWLDKVLEQKTFADIVVHDLRIVAADVSSQEYVIYSKEQDLRTPIAEAVHASASIPLFFQPLAVGPTVLVDGGLLSNFPSFVFAQGQYPTIGFRLSDIRPPSGITSTFTYLKALLLTMTEAHDKQRGIPPSFVSYEIATPANIPSTKFALTQNDIEVLYQSGVSTGATVNWKKNSSERPVVMFYDPKPHETLQHSLQQANKVLEKYSKKESWVEELYNQAIYTVRIAKDWTTLYLSDCTLTVSGNKQLFVSQFRSDGIATNANGAISLMDCHFVADEVIDKQRKEQLIRIPAYNRDSEKGFLLVFSPPISSGSPRRMKTAFEIKQEFLRTLARGQDDCVSFGVRQAAHVHRLKLTFSIEIDDELPEILCEPEFSGEFIDAGFYKEPTSNRRYRKLTCDLGEATVQGVIGFKVNLKRMEDLSGD